MSSAKQLSFPNGYKEAQARVDRVAVSFQHLLSYVDTHEDPALYWRKRITKLLAELSVDLEEADRRWRVEG